MHDSLPWIGFLEYYHIIQVWIHSAGTGLSLKIPITEESGIETHIDVLPFQRKWMTAKRNSRSGCQHTQLSRIWRRRRRGWLETPSHTTNVSYLLSETW